MTPVRRIGICFGSGGGTTREAAQLLAGALFSLTGLNVTLADVSALDLQDLADHDLLLLGAPTWPGGGLHADWEDRLGPLHQLDLRGRRVGVFGSGQGGATSAHGLTQLAEAAQAAGATLVGRTGTAGHGLTASRAGPGSSFVSLLLDDNAPGPTPDRLRHWAAQLSHELGLPLRAARPA